MKKIKIQRKMQPARLKSKVLIFILAFAAIIFIGYLAQREKYEDRLDELVQEIPQTEKKISQGQLFFNNLKKKFWIMKSKGHGEIRN
jgi:hypothetical protein